LTARYTSIVAFLDVSSGDDSEGVIQLATTLEDPGIKNITARALLTDGQKISPLSDPNEATLGLGEVRSEDTLEL
jgi:hypothetical protein